MGGFSITLGPVPLLAPQAPRGCRWARPTQWICMLGEEPQSLGNLNLRKGVHAALPKPCSIREERSVSSLRQRASVSALGLEGPTTPPLRGCSAHTRPGTASWGKRAVSASPGKTCRNSSAFGRAASHSPAEEICMELSGSVLSPFWWFSHVRAGMAWQAGGARPASLLLR